MFFVALIMSGDAQFSAAGASWVWRRDDSGADGVVCTPVPLQNELVYVPLDGGNVIMLWIGLAEQL